MKKYITGILFISFLAGITSCRKELVFKAERTFPSQTEALLKINYLSAYALNPGVQLSLNGQRVSGLITGRTPFPGGGYNTNGSSFPDYLKVASGSNTLSIAIPKKNTNIDSVALFSTTFTVDALKNYTLHVSDTGIKTKAFLITDYLTPAAAGTSLYKFVNMMPNVPYMDLYYNTTLVSAGIPYLGSSNYFTMPSVAGTWSIRESGTAASSTALATYPSGSTVLSQRVYTAFSSGYKGATATNTKPYISFLLNY